jgi:hypothetical protein
MIKPAMTYAQSMEFCCSFGLRLVQIESLAKFQCMIDARVRTYLSCARFRTGIVATTCTHFADNLLQNGMEYLVGASRMGYLSKPVWCPSNVPMNLSLFLSHNILSNTNDADFNIFVRFEATRYAKTYFDAFGHLGCENI